MFKSQHPHGSSQPSVILVPEGPAHSLGLFRQRMHRVHRQAKHSYTLSKINGDDLWCGLGDRLKEEQRSPVTGDVKE